MVVGVKNGRPAWRVRIGASMPEGSGAAWRTEDAVAVVRGRDGAGPAPTSAPAITPAETTAAAIHGETDDTASVMTAGAEPSAGR
jgi:hypothetical protein